MNYRIPRAMCLAANYPVKNDPFLDIRVCVCMCVCVSVCVCGVERLTRTGWCHTTPVDSHASSTHAHTSPEDGYTL